MPYSMLYFCKTFKRIQAQNLFHFSLQPENLLKQKNFWEFSLPTLTPQGCASVFN